MTNVMTLEKSFIIEDRNKYINRIDILGKIKPVTSILPDGENMTIKAAAKYYEVDRSVIERQLARHKDEFEQDGVRTVTKHDSEFELYAPVLTSGQHVVKLVSRRALLRLGMLLTMSQVAQKVRDYLVNLDVLMEEEEPKQTKRERNRNHSTFYMEHRGLSKDVITNLQPSYSVEEGIHSNTDQILKGLMAQLETYKVNIGLVNDMSLRIKELEYELNLKTILADDQQNVIEAQEKTINRLKRDNKNLNADVKAIQKIVFRNMMDKERIQLEEKDTRTYKIDASSGLINN
ncbi:hypothetical protein [Paenibacillus sp. Marseille-Q4541]|uniref:hypothetical protein n=1 Tax=Paenibacillus sp. Marseille-Q4541 TaxID=2831522 RepID=UPI001BA5D3D1|nr:hypothetical protein [Paenibacillus sp. Marseille-Q4541]